MYFIHNKITEIYENHMLPSETETTIKQTKAVTNFLKGNLKQR